MYKHLLIATDGSDLARNAIEHGLKLAAALGAKATVITVTAPWEAVVFGEIVAVLPAHAYNENMALSSSKVLAGAKDVAEKLSQSCETVHVKDRLPAEGIVEYAATNGCDLIVMASHGRRGITRMMLGSVANEVVTRSALPVLVCR